MPDDSVPWTSSIAAVYLDLYENYRALLAVVAGHQGVSVDGLRAEAEAYRTANKEVLHAEAQRAWGRLVMRMPGLPPDLPIL